jgi:hypothetical protein
MLPIANDRAKISSNFLSIKDPLEQFNFFESFVHNFEEVAKFNILNDKCPFNVNKMVHNLVFIADYF